MGLAEGGDANEGVVPADDVRTVVSPPPDVGEAVGEDREPGRGCKAGDGWAEPGSIERTADDEAARGSADAVGQAVDVPRAQPALTPDEPTVLADPVPAVRGSSPSRQEAPAGHERLAVRQVEVDRPSRCLRGDGNRAADDAAEVALEDVEGW